MKDKQRFWIFFITSICLAAMLIGGSFYVFSIQSDLVNLSISNVLTVTEQHQQAFSNFIAQDRERIHSFATYFSMNESSDIRSIREKLSAFDKVGAVYTVIDLQTGTSYNNQSAESIPLSPDDLAYYASLSGSGVREPYLDSYTNTTMFGYYECFTFSDNTRGVFLKGYESAKICEEFSLSFYNNQGFAFVVTREGDILLRSVGSVDGYVFGNIFELIDDSSSGSKRNIRENLKNKITFLNALDNHQTGSLIFHDRERDFVYTYVPVDVVDGWILISIIPQSAIMDEANQIINNSRIMIFLVLIGLVIISVYAFLAWRYSKNIQAKDKEIAYHEQLFNILVTFLSSNTDDVYVMLDKKERKVEYVSPNIERVLGLSQEAVLEDLRAFGRPKYTADRQVGYEELENLRIGAAIGPMESQRINPRTGEQKWFRETVYNVPMQGMEKIIVYMSDRTADHKARDALSMALESAQVANRAKSTFLSSMSHDIRTPMNAIMGLITLLEEEANEPDLVLEYTHRMQAAGQHLLELINDVLDMNKIESGNVTLNIAELSLADIVDEINTIIRPQAKEKNQDFKIFVFPLTSEHLLGDKMRINQVLVNILSNAVKYTPAGGKIEMTVRELPQILAKYSHIQFSVKDNGQGMSEEYQKVMFDPFTREQNTLTNKIQGTGLGMAITKSLVDLMSGAVHVYSREGEGTTFTVELELRIQEQEDDPSFWEHHGITRMVIVDDDPLTCESIAHIMSKTSVDVHTITNGEMVIPTIRKAREDGAPYDLILMDWQMPGLNGLEIASLIRKNYSRNIPILLFTAYDWSDIEQEAMDVGINHFLAKPFFLSNFKETIKKIKGEKEKISDKENSPLQGRHVLIAEDIEVNQLILKKILATRGASCDTAENGQEVLDKFMASGPGEYDLILMDVQMPVMNGYEATRAIRSSGHPSAESVPIVAMTANAFADDVRDALESGMDAHVAKPIVLDQLEVTIRRVFTEKNMIN